MTHSNPPPTATTSARPLRDSPIGTRASTFGVDEYVEGPADGPTPRTVAPLHRHRDEDEAWYVLEGELAVRLDDRVVRAGPGAAVWSRPGVVHTFWNPSSVPTRYLLIMGPKTRAFLEALHQEGPSDPDRIQASAAACGIDLLE
ncbi:MAG: cupin domain-containing protein [Thermoplasmata archaeon]|nr:cupin domain-containing protein [Thermoplasmata archaeon]MCI4356748.1 cupin domain-containing protein [Thermoplasmata archaeon]